MVFTVSDVVQFASTSPITVGHKRTLIARSTNVRRKRHLVSGGSQLWSAVAGRVDPESTVVHPFKCAFPPHESQKSTTSSTGTQRQPSVCQIMLSILVLAFPKMATRTDAIPPGDFLLQPA